ncbi:hypothetical protein GCM10012288_23830 [Malaciobacter pacificus]|nr:hypothetical protein GCM10012288_23830 [Malaciobacter pacificus]
MTNTFLSKEGFVLFIYILYFDRVYFIFSKLNIYKIGNKIYEYKKSVYIITYSYYSCLFIRFWTRQNNTNDNR